VDSFFTPLAASQDVLPGRHVCSHVNALCSAAKAYLVLGEEKYLKAAINGFKFTEAQSYATGAYGAGETFLPMRAEDREGLKKYGIDPSAYDNLGQAILHLRTHFETPLRLLLAFQADTVSIEDHQGPALRRQHGAAHVQHLLGALPLNKFGKAFYQSNYHSHARKEYFDGYGNVMEDEWPCCAGTLPRIAPTIASVLTSTTSTGYMSTSISPRPLSGSNVAQKSR
jgi:uncharacterized protein